MITILIFVLALAALGILATRYGADSRAGAWSDEQQLASAGFAASQPLPVPPPLGTRPAVTGTRADLPAVG